MIPSICTAIREHRRLRFDYGGGTRFVDPYAYGACETHELLRGYQVEGFSHSRTSGWKLFRVEEIANLAVLDQHFNVVKPGYMRNDPCLEVLYSEI
jgi:hypothetical protein